MRNLIRISSVVLLLAIAFGCKKENTAPIADFTIDPTTGNDETIFMFDASLSSDIEDDIDDLEVIWDWEGDGVFDTPYATRKTADHRYEQGNYLVTLVVKDLRGLTDTIQKPLLVTSSNLPPEIPQNPSPAANQEDVKNSANLSWQCSDPEGDYISYTIYFGETNPPDLLKSGHFQTSINPGELAYRKTYYWKVTAKDTEGNTTEGPIWQFSTLNLNFGSLTDSRDGATYQTIEIGSQWWMAENLRFETESSFCYEDDETNCLTYGRLYTWDGAQEACPDGWHLPTKEEFEQLVNTLGGMDVAGGKLKDIESKTWLTPNAGASNISGFGALPAGRRYDHGLFTGKGYYAQFYSSSEYGADEAYNLTLGYDYEMAFLYNYKKKYAISVRCIQN